MYSADMVGNKAVILIEDTETSMVVPEKSVATPCGYPQPVLAVPDDGPDTDSFQKLIEIGFFNNRSGRRSDP